MQRQRPQLALQRLLERVSLARVESGVVVKYSGVSGWSAVTISMNRSRLIGCSA